MIDAPRVPVEESRFDGTNAGGYTTFDPLWQSGAGNGATIKPNGGDTGKTLFIPNADWRNTGGNPGNPSPATSGSLHSATHNPISSGAYRILFTADYLSGILHKPSTLEAQSIRCVRS